MNYYKLLEHVGDILIELIEKENIGTEDMDREILRACQDHPLTQEPESCLKIIEMTPLDERMLAEKFMQATGGFARKDSEGNHVINILHRMACSILVVLMTKQLEHSLSLGTAGLGRN
tara:strand:- start:834 stop:1187 length:354 start_codon:yes stop_codon:yes gene_type:complete